MRNEERITAQHSPRRCISNLPSKHSFIPGEKEMTKFESTSDGNVVIVEPSFDADDPAMLHHPSAMEGAQGSPTSTPLKKPVHRRYLSAHFLDATRLTDDGDDSMRETKREYPAQSARPQPHRSFARPSPSRHFDGSAGAFAKAATQALISPGANVGNKHRRGFSGGVSNPSVAHRRINSIGDSAQVDRFGYYPGHNYHYPPARASYAHRREDSAGLDILSAVADESKEQLQMAAGRARPASKPHWDNFNDANQVGERRMDPPQPVTSAASDEYPPHSYSDSYGYSSSSAGRHGGMHYYRQAPPDSFYPPGAPHHHGGYHHPPQRSPSYPVQYAPLKDPRPYPKSHTHQPVLSGKSDKWSERLDTDERLFQRKEVSHWRGGGTTAGVQTFVTALNGGDDNCTVVPAPSLRNTGTNTDQQQENQPIPSNVGHHRKLSSYSSLGTLMGSALFPDPDQPANLANNGHHRSTSSSVSLLQGLEGESDMFFLQNIHGPSSSGAYSPGPSTKPMETTSQLINVVSNSEASGHALAAGGTSKRIRRKCTVGNCSNRVVQGGLCISHGAKRKTCKHFGCTKNVKKAGLCSTHGPARKRCENDNCNKVAVQGGRCIAHGAKKKLCEFQDCTKQAILSGMCKKHHDISNGIMGARGGEDEPESCTVIEDDKEKPGKAPQRPSHTRGLSIFQEISAESVQTLLSAESSQVHPLKQDQVHPLKGN